MKIDAAAYLKTSPRKVGLLQRSSAQSQVSELALPILKRNNILALVSKVMAGSCYFYLFKGFLHDESHSCHWLSLSNPMNPIKCLLFKGRIPLWFHDVGPAGRSQCQPGLVSWTYLGKNLFIPDSTTCD